VQKRPAARPRAKRVLPEPLTDREVLVLGVLSLWRSSPIFFTHGVKTQAEVDNWIRITVGLWEAPIDVSVKISTSSMLGKITESAFMSTQTDDTARLVLQIVKSALYVFFSLGMFFSFFSEGSSLFVDRSITLTTVSGILLATRANSDAQRLWISLAHQVIGLYVMRGGVGPFALPSRSWTLMNTST
jgi:hypothetical protein